RRRVDRDLRPHVPGGMRERLLRRHLREVLARAAAKRPARRGQDQRVDLLRGPSFETLERSRVLAVDRDQPPSPTPLRRERELAGGDEALLVCEREVDAPLE